MQRADRRGRERGADVDERQDHSGQGEHAAEGVGDRERHRPAEQSQPQRLSADARQVDLVAGEEEQHAKAEVGEELRELVDVRDVERLGPDHHAQHKLDDNHGNEHPARTGQRSHRPGQGRGPDDREERSGVDGNRVRREHWHRDYRTGERRRGLTA